LAAVSIAAPPEAIPISINHFPSQSWPPQEWQAGSSIMECQLLKMNLIFPIQPGPKFEHPD
jgi:hypothetical protein